MGSCEGMLYRTAVQECPRVAYRGRREPVTNACGFSFQQTINWRLSYEYHMTAKYCSAW